MVFVVIGGSEITVLVMESTEVVITAPLMVSVVDQVSSYVTVTGAMLMVVAVDSTKGGRTRVHGG